MKTFRLTAAAVLLVVSTAVSNAQMGRVRDSEYFPRNEVYVQYGTPSIIELTTILNSEYRSEGYDGDSRNHKFSGIAAVGYSFFVHPRVSVGLDFGYGYGSADMYITDSDAAPVTLPIFVCRSAINSYSAHVSASYTYWQQGPMECSGAAMRTILSLRRMTGSGSHIISPRSSSVTERLSGDLPSWVSAIADW